ncbi:DUF6377 domain-containing protein [Parabacteroides sp. OttesenSCG-928-N08]|nr:DUF6377 domain-containing protein [Parabacteroides sp. OttesenSCG-928-N08]
MKRYVLFILFALLAFPSSASVTDSLIHVLDKTIKERAIYAEKKEDDLQNIKKLLEYDAADEQAFLICNQLFSGYIPFNNDSSLYYAQKKLHYAHNLNQQRYIDDATMNLAEVLCTAGMYMESLELMNQIELEKIEEYLRPYYYHLMRKLYGLLADYAITESDLCKYKRLTDLYRDSILSVHDPGSSTHLMVKADQLIANAQYNEGIEILMKHLHLIDPNSHGYAFFTYSIAEAYEKSGDIDTAIHYYTLSAIGDLRLGIKEYVSLRMLAVLLFRKGDVERAYNYLSCSLEDAIACNARIRTIEVSQIFPIINEAYQMKVRKQQQQMQSTLVTISLLSLFLLIAIFYIWRQMKKVAAARRIIVDANKQLKALNLELTTSNEQLKELNSALSETSHIKEEYIGRYMDLCSVYIDKLDLYRRSLAKIASGGKVEELYKAIKSTTFLEKELNEFYSNFDDTFLQLFPNFVEEFNALLTEPLQPKAGDLLNTELRIFALIRLGITDSTKIAHFLRYSVTTIYNYRTRIRNKAAGERDAFENQVMQIGRLPL